MTFLSKHYFVVIMQEDFFDEDYTFDDFVASIEALPTSPRAKSLSVNNSNFAIAPKLTSSDRLVVTPTPDIQATTKVRRSSHAVTLSSLKEELDELRLQMELTNRELFNLYEAIYAIVSNTN